MRFNTLGAAALTVLLATGGTLALAPAASADELPYDVVASAMPAEDASPELGQAQARMAFSITGAGDIHHFREGEPVVVRGTGERGDLIMLHDENGDPLVDVSVGGDGLWRAEIWSLTPGWHYVMAVAPTGETLGIDIIVLAAAKLEIMTPTPGEIVEGGSSMLVNGKGFAGAMVTIHDADGNVLGGSLTDESGYWESYITVPDEGGPFTITVESEGKTISVDIEVTGVETALIDVTPVVPSLGKDGLPQLPEVEGLVYTVTQVTETSWYVTAFALDGYVITDGAQSDWLLEAPPVQPEVVEPGPEVGPEVVDPETVEPHVAPNAERRLAAPVAAAGVGELPATGGALPWAGFAAALAALGLGGMVLAATSRKRAEQ